MIGRWSALMDRYPAMARPTSIVETLGNAGGLSGARMFRFESARGRLVARCWPVDGPNRPQLLQIHAWIQKAADLGFVPSPILTDDGQTVVEQDGWLWELAPWLPGEADLSRPPSLTRVRSMFAGLAAFHARLAPNRLEGPSPGLLRRVIEIDRLILVEFDQIRDQVNRAPDGPVTDLARVWLDRARARALAFANQARPLVDRPIPLQPCLRDARPDHFLLEADRLSGLVDFGAMGVDTVAGDLARLLTEGVGPDRSSRSEALHAYEAIRPLSVAEVRAIEAFERTNALLGAGRWARWHFLEGRPFDDPLAVLKGLRRGLERLEETG